MAKIIILIGGHICTAPRPQKEAETLANAGHDVTVHGFWFNPALVERDQLLITNKKWRFAPIIDFQPTRKFHNWAIRFQGRIAKEKYLRFGMFSPDLLGYGTKAMLKAARKANADLTIIHSEGGLWVGNQLLNKGFRVGVDFEDWFSEDLLPEARATRPIAQLKLLESRLAKECRYCLTTSHALAAALAKAYQVREPTVIYNAFPWSERSQIDHQKRDRQNLNLPSLHWFSQTIGPGRGLEILFQSLPNINIPLEIHLRGNYPESSRQWLEPLIPDKWRDRLFIHPTVPNTELLSRIAEHDIGLALEYNHIPSRNLTVTNKLFQYLQAGLAVIATDTAGQREILSKYPGIGHLIPSNNPIALAQAINELLCNPDKLNTAKAVSLQAFQKQFCWERQVDRFNKLIVKVV
ncbi:glycosyltransferase [Nostoc muscorum FACHB-395]|jgi:glycosyltransferase involved in cell wall biosynthesis|uniref:glycosyltransferase n=1 Tax=Nostoc sp. C057 TaxID=2576903 RepID=UPI0015C35B4D|nr:glycosyltransferase [Nostoc sp. C057]MBD2508830.1 glycosyltransferase [Desmonostoc muscorum FACHB-395]QLE51303.1 glycosyltransferase family 4 protein [Nostoc sp. C057]